MSDSLNSDDSSSIGRVPIPPVNWTPEEEDRLIHLFEKH